MISIHPRVTSKPNPHESITRKGNSHGFKTEKLDKANIEVLFFCVTVNLVVDYSFRLVFALKKIGLVEFPTKISVTENSVNLLLYSTNL